MLMWKRMLSNAGTKVLQLGGDRSWKGTRLRPTSRFSRSKRKRRYRRCWEGWLSCVSIQLLKVYRGRNLTIIFSFFLPKKSSYSKIDETSNCLHGDRAIRVDTESSSTRYNYDSRCIHEIPEKSLHSTRRQEKLRQQEITVRNQTKKTCHKPNTSTLHFRIISRRSEIKTEQEKRHSFKN